MMNSMAKRRRIQVGGDEQLDAMSSWMTQRTVALSEELEALIASARAELSALRNAHKPDPAAIKALARRVDYLKQRDWLEWSIAWLHTYVSLFEELGGMATLAQLTEVLGDISRCEVPDRIDDRLRPLRKQVAAMHAHFEWERVLQRVNAHIATLPAGEEMLEGWRWLREYLGAPVWNSQLGHRLQNVIPANVLGHGRLGRILHSLRGTTGYKKLKSSLLSDDAAKLEAVLAELGTLWTLRQNGASADLLIGLGRENGVERCADIRVAYPAAFDVEVSFLDDPATWRTAIALRAKLERGIADALAGRSPLFVRINCIGLARDLISHVPSACLRLREYADRDLPWSEQLADGLYAEVSQGSVRTQVDVRGATVFRGDETASEGPRRRLPLKVEKEASQVPRGGVVFIWTSQLLSLSAVADIEALADDLRNVGERMTNVAAFAVLDSVDGVVEIVTYRVLSCGGTLHEISTELGRQRLLWIPNPFAECLLSEAERALFKLPFGLYP